MLFSFELSCALFEIGFNAFLPVFAAESLGQKLSLKGQPFGQWHFESGLNRPLDFAYGKAALIRNDELASVIHHLLHEIFFVVDVMNQSHLQSFFESNSRSEERRVGKECRS